MFTGIIESTAKVLQIGGGKLTLERPTMFDDLKIGCSIAVSGACLTVTAFDASSMSFDVVETTMQKTKFGLLKAGDSVNLERAMKADARFEGHIVMGHTEATGTVRSFEHDLLVIEVPESLTQFVVHHGCIMIDGVALTAAELSGNAVTIAVIPHTKAITTLGSLKAGDTVNLETDVLAKYILKRDVSQ